MPYPEDLIKVMREDLTRFGVTVEDLSMESGSAERRELMAFEVERARALFRRGKPLCSEVKGRLGLELRTIWLGGWRILERIEENGYDVFTRRPVISLADKIGIMVSALRRGRFAVLNG